MAAVPRARSTTYVGRRRAVPQPSSARRRVLRGLGAVAAASITAGAFGISEALPQRVEAAAARPITLTADAGAAPSARVSGQDASAAPVVAARVPRLSRSQLRLTAVSRSKARLELSTRAAASAGKASTRRASTSKALASTASCAGKVSRHDFANGRIPLSQLCRLPFAPGHRLRADAAVGLIRLSAAYRAAFGKRLCLTDSYRSYASQVSLAARKPGLAARPGTSEHGLGLAADLCDGAEVTGTRQNRWLHANAPKFGWDNPVWARPGGSRPEAWHWEYVAGQ
ncbi:MAG TPA: M15 family metallopeptidase [Actinomycetales bacterium]|nr:M15 family metallopeptidase [Actinomycetales bacterium]